MTTSVNNITGDALKSKANSKAYDENYDRIFGKKPQVGDTFSIEGVGRGSKGQLVVDGHIAGTNRKCKAVKPAKYQIVSDATYTQEDVERLAYEKSVKNKAEENI